MTLVNLLLSVCLGMRLVSGYYYSPGECKDADSVLGSSCHYWKNQNCGKAMPWMEAAVERLCPESCGDCGKTYEPWCTDADWYEDGWTFKDCAGWAAAGCRDLKGDGYPAASGDGKRDEWITGTYLIWACAKSCNPECTDEGDGKDGDDGVDPLCAPCDAEGVVSKFRVHKTDCNKFLMCLSENGPTKEYSCPVGYEFTEDFTCQPAAGKCVTEERLGERCSGGKAGGDCTDDLTLYANYGARGRKAKNEKVTLVDTELDPLCECAALCGHKEADVYVYNPSHKKVSSRCKCIELTSPKSKLKAKKKTGVTVGTLTDQGEAAWAKKRG